MIRDNNDSDTFLSCPKCEIYEEYPIRDAPGAPRHFELRSWEHSYQIGSIEHVITYENVPFCRKCGERAAEGISIKPGEY